MNVKGSIESKLHAVAILTFIAMWVIYIGVTFPY